MLAIPDIVVSVSSVKLAITPTYLLNLSRLKITDTARDIQTPTKFVFLNINKVLPNQINSPLTMAL